MCSVEHKRMYVSMNVVVVCLRRLTHLLWKSIMPAALEGSDCTAHIQLQTYMKEAGPHMFTRCTCSHPWRRNRAWSNLLCALACRMVYCLGPFSTWCPAPFSPFRFSLLNDGAWFVQISNRDRQENLIVWRTNTAWSQLVVFFFFQPHKWLCGVFFTEL